MSSIHQVQLGKVVITTHVITTLEQLDQSLRELLWLVTQHIGLKRVIGLDIEKHYNPSSKTSCSSSRPGGPEKVAALMLCCGNSCLLIQLLQMDSLYASCYISEFLQLHDVTFVGVGMEHCLEALGRDYGIKCRNTCELGQLLPRVMNGFEGSIIELARKVARVDSFVGVKEARRMCSGGDLSDWGATTLSKRQIEAATARAYLCFYVGNYFYEGCCKRFRFWEHGYDYYFTRTRCQKFIDCLVCWIWLIACVFMMN